ncbi:hypothetical protein B0T18DRAFT_426794 [Schizothecium vesticola]|uniref:C3H1-type domain-containing protein n=1 Tax=Schizothecium vesticola TaxID=314040 RepID=A0AA40F753_9PEZI|nr:hypothetical protein B0T18DRAFT_426794 [Schizothecium vesticola]
MAGAMGCSAVVAPTKPASPPPSPPELPTTARQDVPRSVPHSVTECGNRYIYLRDPSVSRHLQYSIAEDRLGSYADDRTPTAAPELRSHGEGPERFFPSRAASSSPHRYHDSSGATTSAKTATRNTSPSTRFTGSDHFSLPPHRTAAKFPNYGFGSNRGGSFNNAATTPEAQASTIDARSKGQQAEPSTPTAHQMSTNAAAVSSPRGLPAGFLRAQATTAFGNLYLGGSRLGAGIGSPTSVHSGARSFASSDDRYFGIGAPGQPSPIPMTTPSGFAVTPAACPATLPPQDHEAFYREQAFHHQLAAGNPAVMDLHRFRDPSVRNPHIRGPDHDAAAEQALLAQYLADVQNHAQSADQQHAMTLYALSERNPLVDQAAQDESTWTGAVPAPVDRPPYHMFALHRGLGMYTPLVPADMLPPLVGVPRQVGNVAGIWVLPPPRVPAPDGHWVYHRRIAVRGNAVQDNAQSASPSSQHHQHSPASATQNPYEGHAGLVYPPEDLQFAANHFRPLGWSPPHKARIDGIVAARSANQTRPGTIPAMPATTSPTTPVPRSATAAPPQRRVKIYCDKWVHEGICAFTQQGCKYKHEMPQDKATQHSLGLFHGLPAWWRKQQGELARSSAPSAPSLSGDHTPPPGPRRFGTQSQPQPTMTTTTTQGMGQQQGVSVEDLRLSLFPLGRLEDRKEEEKGGKDGKGDKDGDDGDDGEDKK